MLKMPKCVFCKENYEFPRGITLVKKDGSVNYLCSSKCRKNMLMKRRKVRWILKEKKVKEEEPKKVEKAPEKPAQEASKEDKKEAPKDESKAKEEPKKEEQVEKKKE